MMSLNTEEEITLRSLSVNLHARQIITTRTSNAHFHLAAFSLIIYINMTCSLHLREVLQCNTAKINHTSLAFSLLQMCSRCIRYKHLVQRPTSHERPDISRPCLCRIPVLPFSCVERHHISFRFGILCVVSISRLS